MAKINVYSLKPPAKKSETFEISNETNDGVVVTLKLVEPDFPTMLQIGEVTAAYIKKYMEKVPGTEEYLPFPLIDGQQVKLTEELIQISSIIYCMQDVGVSDYTVEEIIIIIITMDVAMLPVIGYAQSLSERLLGLIQNPTQAATLPLSVSIVNTTNDTLF